MVQHGLPSNTTAQIVVADGEFKQLLASAQLEEQTNKLKDASDWEESEVLARLVHVNEAQHRRGDYFCRLQSVVRCASLHTRLAAAKNAHSLAEIPARPTESNDTISLYNVLLPLSAALPLHARGSAAVGQHLPESLGINWSFGIPHLLVNKFTEQDGYQQLVDASSAQYGLKHCTQPTTAATTGSSRRIEHVMATRATIAENLSLPVFASTQPHADGAAAAVQYSLPKLKCFQRQATKHRPPQHTLQAGSLASELLPEVCAEKQDRQPSASGSKAVKQEVPHKVKGSGVVKPAISDWKAVLKKQRRGKETSAPVTVDALQDVNMRGNKREAGSLQADGPVEGKQVADKKSEKSKMMGDSYDFMDLLMQGSGKT